MQLLENSRWLTDVAKLDVSDAEKLTEEIRIKRLLLIRLHIGKFLAEKDLFESLNFKDSSFYCSRMNRATGFKYEPDGYLLDMEPEFYSGGICLGMGGGGNSQTLLGKFFRGKLVSSTGCGFFFGKNIP